MDLSSHGNTQPFRRKLTSECPAMIGTVPVYDSVIHYQRDLATLTARDFIDVIRMHAEDGVDFVTLHCGITRKTIEQIKKHTPATGPFSLATSEALVPSADSALAVPSDDVSDEEIKTSAVPTVEVFVSSLSCPSILLLWNSQKNS